jgi:hypothetical protein
MAGKAVLTAVPAGGRSACLSHHTQSLQVAP